MFKQLFNKKENKGYVSIEVIIIAAIMLSLFALLFIRWQKTADDLSTSTIIGMEEQVNDIKDPNTGERFIDMINDPDTLLGQTTIKTKPFTFEKSTNQEQTYTLTIDNLNKIKNITVSNGGTVEVVSTNGNEVTIKVTGGEITESIVVSGEYIAYAEKVVTAQDSPNYNDGVYSGTLKQYLHSGEASKSQTVTENKTYSSLSAVPNTVTYNVAGYTGTLNKVGETESTLISGTPANLKEVTQTVKKNSNSFDNTLSYSEGELTGTLSKSGSMTSKLLSGHATGSKTVTNQPSANYSDSEGYTGTLTRYVVSGQAPVSKTATETVKKSTNSFDNTFSYNKDGYTGTLSKSGSMTSRVVSGTAPASKWVTNQSSASYSDADGYFGTLSEYVASGTAGDSRTQTSSQTGSSSSSSNYPASISYNSGGYSGTLYQTGSPKYQSYSYSISKYVSGHSSSYYNDGTYSGTLSSSTLVSGSPADSKEVSWSHSEGSGGGGCFPYTQGEYSGTVCYQGYTEVITGYTTVTKSASDKCYNQVVYQYNSSGAFTGSYHTNPCPQSVSYNDGYYSGTLGRTGESSSGSCSSVSGPKNGECRIYWVAYYSGTVHGTRPEYKTTFYFRGTISKPDTRVYSYSGTVYGTAYDSYYEQSYSGTVTRPDTRVFKYQGNVSKQDTRVYEYSQAYTGTVSTADTRQYAYQGTVSRPETRVYEYSQDYKGVISKPDTRIYEYSQTYSGTVATPDTRVYKYQGLVTRPESDTRQYEHYYQYDVEVYYFEKQE